MAEGKKIFTQVVHETSIKVIELEDRIESLENIIQKLVKELNRLEKVKLNKAGEVKFKKDGDKIWEEC